MYSLALTKLDILSNIGELKIGINYKYKGETLPSFPGRTKVLEGKNHVLKISISLTSCPKF